MAGDRRAVPQHASKADFRAIDLKVARVILVEAGPRVLPDLQRQACGERSRPPRREAPRRGHARHEGHGRGHRYVELSTAATGRITVSGSISGRREVTSRRRSRSSSGMPLDRARARAGSRPGPSRFPVIARRCRRSAATSALSWTRRGRPVPGVIWAAMQMGPPRRAKNVIRQLAGKTPLLSWYVDKGSLSRRSWTPCGIADNHGPAVWRGRSSPIESGRSSNSLPCRVPEPDPGVLQWAWAYVFHTLLRRAASIRVDPGAPQLVDGELVHVFDGAMLVDLCPRVVSTGVITPRGNASTARSTSRPSQLGPQRCVLEQRAVQERAVDELRRP
jgi:hypothetical protein